MDSSGFWSCIGKTSGGIFGERRSLRSSSVSEEREDSSSSMSASSLTGSNEKLEKK